MGGTEDTSHQEVVVAFDHSDRNNPEEGVGVGDSEVDNQVVEDQAQGNNQDEIHSEAAVAEDPSFYNHLRHDLVGQVVVDSP